MLGALPALRQTFEWWILKSLGGEGAEDWDIPKVILEQVSLNLLSRLVATQRYIP